MREKVRQEAPRSHRAGTTEFPAIELHALCKSFGALQALDHLTLSVEQGEIFGLLGPNGSGKTTSINLISGLSTPTSGEVQVMGYDVHRHARRIRQMLGAVPQETALYEELSAWDNLDFHADLFGMPRKEKQERDAYPRDLGYIPYLAVPILVIGLMVGGMVQAGTAAAVEWERETVKELLLSPASRVAILLGKMGAAFLIGLAGAAIVLAMLIALMGIRPEHWGELIGFTLLILALFTVWGTLLGTWLQRRTPVATLAIGLCVPLFFLSGPFGPISFFAPIEQLVALVFPVYYAIVVLQHAVHGFTLTTSAIGVNVLILAVYTLGGLVLATIVVRHSTTAH